MIIYPDNSPMLYVYMIFLETGETPITKEDVVKYCRTQLTGYKIPKQIIFVDSLPKTAVGKILRRELKDIS